MNDETHDFLQWRDGFSLADDGLAAYRALRALEKIQFELATKEGGYIGRIESAVQDATRVQ